MRLLSVFDGTRSLRRVISFSFFEKRNMWDDFGHTFVGVGSLSGQVLSFSFMSDVYIDGKGSGSGHVKGNPIFFKAFDVRFEGKEWRYIKTV